MTRQLIICSLFLCGCNLFRATAATDAGGADSGVSDMGATDVAMQDDGAPVSDQGQPDAFRDEGTTCVPETDDELCAAQNADCGILRGIPADADVFEFAAVDIDFNLCEPVDGLANVCNPFGGLGETLTITRPGAYLAVITAGDTSDSAVRAELDLHIDGSTVGRVLIKSVVPEISDHSLVIENLTAGDHDFVWDMVRDAYFPTVDFDMNVSVQSVRFIGPLDVGVVDRCGTARAVDCGSCEGGSQCGKAEANVCHCACPLPDGSCAPEGPHPTDVCLTCTLSRGWDSQPGSCDDGDACTVDDTCRQTAGICLGTQMSCDGDVCEVGACVDGACQFSNATDGDTCGATGICADGACGCVGGPFVETICSGNTDDDCDGLLNCEDPDCDGQPCGGQRTCVGGVCL